MIKKENNLLIILFILSTIFFLYQHYVNLPWDYLAYLLNAKYWFSDGTYFEILRAPLMPFITGLLSIVSWSFAEYSYIILVSGLFLVSTIKLADALKFNRLYLYILSLNIYVLLYGLFEGTELLALSLFEFFIAALISNKTSGHYLGLAVLARYTYLGTSPLLLFYKKPKEITKNILLFLLVLIPWFVYNKIKYGNFLTSLADSYAQNVLFRKDYILQSINPSHLLLAVNILLPFLILGLFYIITNKARIKKENVIMFLILIYSILDYYSTPIKSARYLYLLSLPAIYFAYIGILGITKSESKIKNINLIILLITFIFALFVASQYSHESNNVYKESITTLNNLKINNCSIISNGWVILNYLDQPASEFTRKELIEKRIEQGHVILLFFHIKEPDYVSDKIFIDSLPALYAADKYVILGNNKSCAKQKLNNQPYVFKLNQTIMEQRNENTPTDPCIILFDSDALKSLCQYVIK